MLTNERYKSAIDHCIQPTEYMEKRIRHAILNERRTRTAHRRIFRPATVVVATLVLVIFSFGTAMAASPEFRQAVISLFQIKTPEVIPTEPVDPMLSSPAQSVASQNVEDKVSIQYIKVEGWGDVSNGTIIRHPQGNDEAVFYAVENGALKQLESSYVDVNIPYKKEAVPLRFYYCVYNGQVKLSLVEPEERGDTFAYVSPIDGRTDAVLLSLVRDRQSENSTEYPLLLDLNTKKTTDLFSGINLASIGQVGKITLTDDLKKAVLRVSDRKKSTYHICDMETGNITAIEKIAEGNVSTCGLLDNDTLYYTLPQKDGMFDYWTVRFATGGKRQILQGATFYNDLEKTPGIAFLGGRHALSMEQDGEIFLIDLRTGDKALIEGLLSSNLSGAGLLSPDGDRILFTLHGPDGGEWTQLGELHIPSGKLTMLKREGMQIRQEMGISWFDDKRIAIQTTKEGEGNYLYLYEFAN